MGGSRLQAPRTTLLPLAVVAVVLVLAAPASAGTAHVQWPVGPGAIYDASPGEANQATTTIDVQADQSVVFTIHDPVGVAAGDGCESLDSRTARCQIPPRPPNVTFGSPTWSVQLGDRNDSSAGEGAFDGGDGDDNLTTTGGGLNGGPGDDVLTGNGSFVGGPGNDVMTGGPGGDKFEVGVPDIKGERVVDALNSGNDVMRGGGGNDSFNSATRADGSDRIIGGPGRDTVDYHLREASIRADLQGDADDGGRGERDRIGADVEDLVGGTKSDRLAGNGARNRLDGAASSSPGAPKRRRGDRIHAGGGRDVILGSLGADRISAGAGRDTVNALAGNDRIAVKDGARDKVNCGQGSDRVTADRRDRLVRRSPLADPATGDVCEHVRRSR